MNLHWTLADARGRPWLAAIDPRVKLAWLVWMSSASVLVDSIAALALLFGLACLAVMGLKMRPRGWLVIGALLAAVGWGTLLSQALFYAELPRTPLMRLVPAADLGVWRFPGLWLYREGAEHGLIQSLRILSAMLAGLSVCLSTSPEQILAGMLRLGAPTAIGFLSVTGLRFMPLLLSEMAIVRQARTLRGYRPGFRAPGVRRGWISRLRMEGRLLLPVLAAALGRCSSLATSVAARGFDPSAPRTHYPDLALTWAERVALSLLLATFLLLASAKLLYWLYLGDLYYRPGLRGLYEFTRSWL